MGRFAAIIATAAIVGGGAYLLFGYVTGAPSVRLGIVVIAGAVIAVGAALLVVQILSLWRRT